jgi:hypothetical protein
MALGERLQELRASEAERARRQLPAGEPLPGQVWAVATSIDSEDGRATLEHTRIPLSVIILRANGRLFQVVPLSFEVDLAGPFDVQIGEEVLGRPAVAEVWLRMPVTRRALARVVAVIPEVDLARVRAAAAQARVEAAADMTIDDPRRAFREDERARVLFAVAGTGEEIEIEASDEPIESPAFGIKREPVLYREAEAPEHSVQAADPYQEFVSARSSLTLGRSKQDRA